MEQEPNHLSLCADKQLMTVQTAEFIVKRILLEPLVSCLLA